ncbi:protein neprosin-like [Vicia villosa]|uniref:protein neprosin-like n=1 Tax=Vicia villosa TaxID=3911 RepID=UPI00273BC5AC|nr:protein neprosin-like [Vicia villosa]
MMNVLFIFMCSVSFVTSHQFDNKQNTLKEDLEIERELKLLNKAPVKSIYTKFGYIIDCIDINNQPAFDHSLLMNHKLQKKPSFRTKKRKNSVKSSSTKALSGLQKAQCPTGTVPIKRTTKDDLIRGKSYFNNGLVGNLHGNHYAEVITLEDDEKSYYGVAGTNSVYNFKVNKDQSSSSVMFVRDGPESINYIGMGWHVAPQLYNDDETHFYVVWTTDNFKNTGCFNLLCPGFVQTSQTNYLGGQFSNTSIHGGPIIAITMSISQFFWSPRVIYQTYF